MQIKKLYSLTKVTQLWHFIELFVITLFLNFETNISKYYLFIFYCIIFAW